VTPLLAIAALALTSYQAPQSTVVDSMVADRLAGNPNAGIVIATVDGGTTQVFSRGKAALDGNSAFNVGALTEVFIAIALADMVAKKEVDLRDPVARYLPGIPVPTRGGKSITLEDLVMHRSALPRLLPGMARSEANRLTAYTTQRLAAFLEGYELPRDIGSQYERSPLGIALLATALSTRAGVPLETLLQDRVIKPLGMNATTTMEGMLRSTPNDLVKFAAANLQDGPLSSVLSDTRSSRGPSTSVGANPAAQGESRGLGWRIRTSGRRQLLWSSGAAGGQQVFIGLDPDAERAVVVLHNQLATVDDIGFALLEQLREAATPIDAGVFASFAGEYEIKRGSSVVIRFDGRRLLARVGEEPESTLTQESELRFVFNDSESRIVFVRDAGQKTVIGLMLHRSSQHIAARKVR